MRGLNTAGAPKPVVSRSCSLRSRAARATASFSHDRVRDQSARPLKTSMDRRTPSCRRHCVVQLLLMVPVALRRSGSAPSTRAR